MYSNLNQMAQQPGPPPVPPRRNLKKPVEKIERRVHSLSEINKIQRLLSQSITKYNNELVENSGLFGSEEDLLQANEYLLKQIITQFKEETEVDDVKFLDDFVTELKAKANKILDNFRLQFRQHLPEEDQYSEEQEREGIYEQLPTHQPKHEEEEEEEEEVRSENGYIEVKNEQDETISTVSSDFGILDSIVSPDYRNYIKLYRHHLKNSIEYPIDETEINETHRELRSEAIQRFRRNERGGDVHVFGQCLDQCFNDFKIKLFEKHKKLQNCLKDGKRIYVEGMDDHLKNGRHYSEQRLSEIHKSLRETAIQKTEDLIETLIKQKEIDFEEWTQELTKSIDNEFQRYKERNELAKLKNESEFVTKICEYSERYENEINNLIETAESQDELTKENEQLKSKLEDQFKTEMVLSDPDTLISHLIKLGRSFSKSFEKANDLLEFKLQKRKMDKEIVIKKIREEYKQKMQNKFEIKKFYFKTNFVGIHENILSELSIKHKKGLLEVAEIVQDIYVEFDDFNARMTPKVPAIGIDLGTTNSCVAYFTSDLKLTKSTVVMPNELGKDITPSVVSFRDNNEVVVGDVAKQEEGVHIHNTIYSVKRLIGQSFDDLNRNKTNKRFLENLEFTLIDQGNKPKISVKADGVVKEYFPEEISAKVLEKMKVIAETYLEGFDVKKVVITVPAYFNESQKVATKHAGTLAGLEVLGIISEPTAAAIAFKVDRNIDLKEKTILIFDFGGGTLDVAIVRLQKGDIEAKAVKGDNYLGGEDIDNNLIDYCLTVFRSQMSLNLDKKQLRGDAIPRLRRACQEAKIKLTSVYTQTISITNFHQNYDLKVEITRSKFNEINKAIFEKAVGLVKETLKDAKLKEKDIDDIVLVGGSTRIPRIQEMLSKMFNNRALNHTINPDLSVAVGAAIHAATLNGQSTQNQLFQFTDVTPMAYGVEKANKEMFILIPRNTKLPVKVTRKFDTCESNQTTVEIRVYEGDDRVARNNHLLGDFKLFGIPPAKRGAVNIEVTFEIKEDGVLRVSAKCDKIVGNLEIKEHKSRLTEEELQELIEKSKFEYLKDHGKKTSPDYKKVPATRVETIKAAVQRPIRYINNQAKSKFFTDL